MMTWNGLFFHSPSSILLETVILMHDFLMMLLLSVMMLILLIMTYNFFNKEFNLEFFENHQIETIWTIIPFLILLFIVVPSLKSLYLLDSCIFCGLTISISGHQWYWSYFFKELENFSFDSYMIDEKSLNLDMKSLRLIEVDNRVVIPSLTPVRFLVTSSDVLHSWTLPSFGIKMDAVPGRVNQFCTSLKKTGIFFGQCSEICGTNHSFMPIVVESVNMKDFINMI